MDVNTLILIGGILLQAFAVIRFHSWIMDKMVKKIITELEISPELDVKIDGRVEVNPALKEQGLTLYKISQLQADVAANKGAIQQLQLKLAKMNGEIK